MRSKKKKKRRKTKLPKLKVDKQKFIMSYRGGIVSYHGGTQSSAFHYLDDMHELLRFCLAHGFPGLVGPVALGLMPRQHIVHRAQSSCSLRGQNVREGTGARVPIPLEGWSPVAQLLPDRPHLPEVPPSSPSSAKVWKPGLNTWASWRHSEPQTLAE